MGTHPALLVLFMAGAFQVAARVALTDIEDLGELMDKQQRLPVSDMERKFAKQPIFNLGMPKSGSDSLMRYFLCRGFDHSSHYYCGHDRKGYHECGKCIDRATRESLSLKTSCGYHSTYSQMDVEDPSYCSFPQMTHIHYFMHEYPESKFILLERDPESWLHSVVNWSRHMELRILRCWLLLGQIPYPAGLSQNKLPALDDTREDTVRTWLKIYKKYDGARLLKETFSNHFNKISARFRYQPERLLRVNLTDCHLERKINRFLQLPFVAKGKASCFPHTHASTDSLLVKPSCDKSRRGLKGYNFSISYNTSEQNYPWTMR